ncbi:MmgE/PrpD family protein [Pseudarthrobacter sulfonivorans]|nr:MmgE/PrpD family protein [Pseudarthrobacter sulfonivorans]
MSEMQNAGLTHRLAEFIVGFAASGVTDESLREAERAFIDTIGVAIAASGDETMTRLLEALDTHASVGPARSLIGSPSRQPAQMALVNGTASHALDFDDVTEEIQGHPSTVLVPVALAVGEEIGAGGRDVLEAYLVGYHTEFLLASILDGPKHYALGWHATATLGVIGAAAASAYLYKLGVEQTVMALAISGTMAAGSRRNFGTMTKPLHAGLAASHGIEAAQLARAGFTASEVMLEAQYGFLGLFGLGTDLARADTISVPIHGLGEHKLSVKKYPACFNTHRTIDAVLDCGPLDAGDVERIEVTVQTAGLEPLIHHRPTTGLEAKFSLEYTAAAALFDGGVSLESFENAAVNRPDLQALLRKVSVTESPTPPTGSPGWHAGYSCVSVVMRDGNVVSSRRDQPRGHASAPLTDAELHEKFVDCVQYTTGDKQEQLLAALDNLRAVSDIRELPFPTMREGV